MCLAPNPPPQLNDLGRELYYKYEEVQFSKKHQEQYLKYTPDEIDKGISQLFSG